MKPNPQILSDSKLLDSEAFDVIEEDPRDASAVELGLNMLDLLLDNLDAELSGNTIGQDLDNAELQVSQLWFRSYILTNLPVTDC
jgi:hypothetical protein